MDIKSYIKELLFIHDCVIVPGFGGFITSYQHAEIQKFRNVIFPPSKTVSFNKKLQSNDGILIDHVANQEGCSYAVAEEKVKSFAGLCNKLLNGKTMLNFPEIGKIYYNTSGLLIFLPELRKNFMAETFGLKPVTFEPDHLENENESMTNEQLTEKITDRNKRRRRIQMTGLVASVLLVLLFSQLIIWDIAPAKLELQGLNIINVPLHEEGENHAPRDVIRQKPDVIFETTRGTIPGSDTEKVAEEKSPGELATNTINEPEPKRQPEKKEEINRKPEPVKPNESAAYSGKGYFIIFGSFESEENAQNLKAEISQKYNGTVQVLHSRSGNYRVGLFASESKSRAQQILKDYQSRGSSSLWMIYSN